MGELQPLNLEDASEILVCAECLTALTPPIFMCRWCSKSYCEACKYTVLCVACQIPIGDIRNALFEQLAYNCHYTCRY